MRLAAGGGAAGGGSYSAPRPFSRFKEEGREGKGRKGLGIGWRKRMEGKDVKGGRGMEVWEGEGRYGKGKGGMGRGMEVWEGEGKDGKERESKGERKRKKGKGKGGRARLGPRAPRVPSYATAYGPAVDTASPKPIISCLI